MGRHVVIGLFLSIRRGTGLTGEVHATLAAHLRKEQSPGKEESSPELLKGDQYLGGHQKATHCTQRTTQQPSLRRTVASVSGGRFRKLAFGTSGQKKGDKLRTSLLLC